MPDDYKIILIGGPYDGYRTVLSGRSAWPRQIQVESALYRIILDPDTDEPLGGYLFDKEVME